MLKPAAKPAPPKPAARRMPVKSGGGSGGGIMAIVGLAAMLGVMNARTSSIRHSTPPATPVPGVNPYFYNNGKPRPVQAPPPTYPRPVPSNPRSTYTIPLSPAIPATPVQPAPYPQSPNPYRYYPVAPTPAAPSADPGER
jgi:hypothetical protein